MVKTSKLDTGYLEFNGFYSSLLIKISIPLFFLLFLFPPKSTVHQT